MEGTRYFKRADKHGHLEWIATVPEGHVMETDEFVTEITHEEYLKCQQELANAFVTDDELQESDTCPMMCPPEDESDKVE